MKRLKKNVEDALDCLTAPIYFGGLVAMCLASGLYEEIKRGYYVSRNIPYDTIGDDETYPFIWYVRKEPNL